ncbi:hypothetical protein R4Z10_05255 [Niallia sp. XMNu-256]|uniref:hypothetical protein n=1 Tax=Niallia sp. XMNu-256 TaxID=3082444 RepID=UPI0030D017F8
MDNNEKKETTFNEEIDPFTAFMFGKPIDKSESDERKKEGQDSTLNNDWLFGRRHSKETGAEQNSINDLLNQIDTEKLMKNIDLLVETAQEFKPLWKKITPYLDKFKK